jgi:hypothetical protein
VPDLEKQFSAISFSPNKARFWYEGIADKASPTPHGDGRKRGSKRCFCRIGKG